MGLISGAVEDLEKCQELLGEVMATFEVNRDRMSWTGEELRKLYEFYEKSWRPRYRAISQSKGGAA